MRIGVMGAGYVGLVTAACLAAEGHHVTCVERDADRLALLAAGGCPVHEPGLAELLSAQTAADRLAFSHSAAAAVAGADLVFLCVGTPAGVNGAADLDQVEQAAAQIGAAVDGPLLVVSKSTVPVSTHARVAELLARHAPAGTRVSVAANPEFLREGTAVADFMAPARVVIGVTDPADEALLRAVYAPFVARGVPLLVMSPIEAELTKHAANAFLAMRVSFANLIDDLCLAGGADSAAVLAAAGADPRIGAEYLHPGLGYGGSCLPKDMTALVAQCRASGVDPALLAAVDGVNARRRDAFAAGVVRAVTEAGGSRVAVWGLAFKPGTDDVRCSPAVPVIAACRQAGLAVTAHDPVAADRFAAAYSHEGVVYAGDAWEALDRADALVVIAAWDEYRAADPGRIAARMAGALVLDGAGALDAAAARAAGLDVRGAADVARLGEVRP